MAYDGSGRRGLSVSLKFIKENSFYLSYFFRNCISQAEIHVR